jgi:hypothetical protein
MFYTSIKFPSQVGTNKSLSFLAQIADAGAEEPKIFEIDVIQRFLNYK